MHIAIKNRKINRFEKKKKKKKQKKKQILLRYGGKMVIFEIR